MKTLPLILAVVLAALALPLLLPAPAPAPDDARLQPWNIAPTGDGRSRVFGLTLGLSTLSDAEVIFQAVPEVAIVGLRDEAGSLEAFYDPVRLNALTGKMVLTLAAPADQLSAMRQRAQKTEHMESAVLRSTLHADDRAAVNRFPIAAIVFVPAARLDEATLVSRFGPPAERVGADDITHLLYPALGLDIALSAKGKVQLQYVAPAGFTRVREPLLKPAAAPSPR